MNRWKEFRTNMMYWRFRYLTRNRLRLRSWWQRRRFGARSKPATNYYRERGMAAVVYRDSARRSWTALLVLVSLLTALSVYVNNTLINPGLVYLIGSLIVVCTVYWALRGV